MRHIKPYKIFESNEDIDLQNVADEIIDGDYLRNYSDMESEGDDVLRMDYDGDKSIWLYRNGGFDGKASKRLKKLLVSKGFKTVNGNF